MLGHRLAAIVVATTLLAGCTAKPADVPDCDAGDRKKHETPDCGFSNKGRFVEWTWVKAGKTTAPAGWSAAKEKKAVTATKKAKR